MTLSKRCIEVNRGGKWKKVHMKNLFPGDVIRICDDDFLPDTKWKVADVPKIINEKDDVWGVECVQIFHIEDSV